jgi:acetate kinase
MKILVINAGSSSLKYQLIDMSTESVVKKGIVERLVDHTSALKEVLKEVGIENVDAFGHRIVHSGEDFNSSIVFDDENMAVCEQNIELAPLHMPANLACVKACLELAPEKKNVAVFDTAFHSAMPEKAYLYGIPYELYEKYKIRRYGFHGTSHLFVSEVAAELLGRKDAKIITCHLGNGSSVAAVWGGKSVDTSMGFTPLEGLMMGTRSGDIDAAVVEFIMQKTGMSVSEVINLLNKKSGVLGISGIGSDFRDLNAAADGGHEMAKLALSMFAYRVRRYIGSLMAAMGGCDAIVFTGGIGENSHKVRLQVLQNMEQMGILIDENKNNNPEKGNFLITKETSPIAVYIIPTNEELVIARETAKLI